MFIFGEMILLWRLVAERKRNNAMPMKGVVNNLVPVSIGMCAVTADRHRR
jgi:hypothetical protein